MNEQELQLAFILFLMQATGAQNPEELDGIILNMAPEELDNYKNLFMQMIKDQQIQSAKFGAKLNYLKNLKGVCPEGYKVEYFLKGGHLCKKCAKGADLEENYIDQFKKKRGIKKHQKGGELENTSRYLMNRYLRDIGMIPNSDYERLENERAIDYNVVHDIPSLINEIKYRWNDAKYRWKDFENGFKEVTKPYPAASTNTVNKIIEKIFGLPDSKKMNFDVPSEYKELIKK